MIRCLNLDEKFTPMKYEGIEFEMIRFNGGEMHIKLNNDIDYSNFDKVVITNRFKCGDDLIKVLIAKDALYRKGIKKFDLVMPYIPYSRQDRQCFNGESFTLKIFTDFINSANFDNVYVIDSHSDVAPALINNCVNIPNTEYVKKAYLDITQHNNNDVILVSPDSGANKKSNKLFENLKCFKSIVKCDKKRDVSNGMLSGFEVFLDDLNGTSCLIVDDICSYGGTFMGISKALKSKNAGDIYLFATHYEGVADIKKLSESGICKLYKTNSMNDIENEFINNFKIII